MCTFHLAWGSIYNASVCVLSSAFVTVVDRIICKIWFCLFRWCLIKQNMAPAEAHLQNKRRTGVICWLVSFSGSCTIVNTDSVIKMFYIYYILSDPSITLSLFMTLNFNFSRIYSACCTRGPVMCDYDWFIRVRENILRSSERAKCLIRIRWFAAIYSTSASDLNTCDRFLASFQLTWLLLLLQPLLICSKSDHVDKNSWFRWRYSLLLNI